MFGWYELWDSQYLDFCFNCHFFASIDQRWETRSVPSISLIREYRPTKIKSTKSIFYRIAILCPCVLLFYNTGIFWPSDLAPSFFTLCFRLSFALCPAWPTCQLILGKRTHLSLLNCSPYFLSQSSFSFGADSWGGALCGGTRIQ